jgi:glutamine synthetase
MSSELRNYLALSYDELEELNLEAKEQRRARVAAHKIQEERLKYLTDEKRIKAVTVLFSDLEGRLRQEVPREELGQPHLRRVVHSRLHRAA